MNHTMHFDLNHLGDMLVHMNQQTQEYTMIIVDRKTGTARTQVYDTPSFYKVLDSIVSACGVLQREMDDHQKELAKSVVAFK
jgi:spermidine synthase